MKTNLPFTCSRSAPLTPPSQTTTPSARILQSTRHTSCRKRLGVRAPAGAVAVLCLATALGLHAQTITQTIQLSAGWNAIWVEVDPANRDVGAVFANLPVASVWPYSDKLTSVEFIQNLDELPWNNASWRRWFPANSPHAVLNTLFAVKAYQAYLVQMSNAATLTITGQPSLQGMPWVPDAFNLRGFQVSPSPQSAPTFADYFAPSAAQAGQPVYRLDATLGVWTNVVPTVDRVRSGAAYWVYCRGASTYPGPLKIKLDQGDGLDFGQVAQRQSIYLQNLSDLPMNVSITDVSGAGAGPLSLIVLGTNGYAAQPLPATYSQNIAAGTTERLQLAIRRNAFTGTNYAGVLEITSNLGGRVRLRVSAQKLTGPGSATPFAGLWVGSASVSNVCEVNSLIDPTGPKPTKSSFDLRLIIHVDTNGVARFLKEVIQMWQNGTTTNNAQGYAVTEQPGHYVLVTEDRLISQFQGASLRDGVPVGRRISSVGFDFAGGTNTYLPLAGSFATDGSLTGTLVLSPDFPTNPFRHKYHPDHDNLDAQFVAMAPDSTGSKEAYQITRQIELDFSAQDPAGASSVQSLDYGYDVIGGTYRETVTGLHKNPIVAQGQFRLKRVAVTGVLNQ